MIFLICQVNKTKIQTINTFSRSEITHTNFTTNCSQINPSCKVLQGFYLKHQIFLNVKRMFLPCYVQRYKLDRKSTYNPRCNTEFNELFGAVIYKTFVGKSLLEDWPLTALLFVSPSQCLWGAPFLLAAITFTKTIIGSETNYVIFKIRFESKSYQNYIQLK